MLTGVAVRRLALVTLARWVRKGDSLVANIVSYIFRFEFRYH
jgi:hypothetical protein